VELLDKLQRLDLPPDWWYGMTVRYTIKDGDRILGADEWDDKISEEFGFEGSGNREPPTSDRGVSFDVFYSS
jgi:hypothetical protein